MTPRAPAERTWQISHIARNANALRAGLTMRTLPEVLQCHCPEPRMRPNDPGPSPLSPVGPRRRRKPSVVSAFGRSPARYTLAKENRSQSTCVHLNCVCICMDVCMYVCMYMYMYVYVGVCMYTYVYVCICMYMYVYLCMYVCMHVCMYVCMYVYNTYIYI